MIERKMRAKRNDRDRNDREIEIRMDVPGRPSEFNVYVHVYVKKISCSALSNSFIFFMSQKNIYPL